MKPPALDAVERALAILIQSVNEENGTSFPSQRCAQRHNQALSQLDQNDLVLQVARRSVNNAAKAWIGGLRKSRNALVPIRKLPVELTVEILLRSLRVKERSSLKRLRRLASVSTHWWALISSFPRFWTTISSSHNVEIKLRLSGNMPLTIALHWPAINWHHVPSAERISEHLNRCKNLQLSYDGLEYFRRHLRTTKTPLLEKVDYRGHDPEEPMHTDLPPVHSVHSLRLSAVVLPWSNLTGLKNLRISNIISGNPSDVPSAAELVNMLRLCPLLETLELDKLYREIPDPEEVSAAQPTELTKLKRLVLREIEPMGTAFIISSIQANSLVDFQLLETSSIRGGICTKQCRYLVQNVIRNASFDRIVVSIGPNGAEMNGAGSQGKLLIHHDWERSDIVHGLTELVPRNVKVDLRISNAVRYPDLQRLGPINSIFDRMSGIDWLTLTMHPNMVIQAVKKLSGPITSADKTIRWLAPRLSGLRVNRAPLGSDFTIIHASLTALLDSREQASGTELSPLEVINEAGYKFAIGEEGVREWTRP